MKHYHKKTQNWLLDRKNWKTIFFILLATFFVVCGAVAIWVATLQIPDLQSFQNKVLAGSTKIYDRSGTILLYDLNQDVKQQVVSFDQISQHVKDASISIEDQDFYKHGGISPVAIVRALVADVKSLSLAEGGSTITQQVIKNTLLTTDKKFSRKIKEWVLALKLDNAMSKDDILNLYLNSAPYGGTNYGVEVASQAYFGKKSSDLTVAESAYLAAIPQAPTYYSPFGKHLDALENRKNLVLQKMKERGYISDEEYGQARAEKVTFKKREAQNIKAPHFAMFIKDYLVEKYGEDEVAHGSLKVITTLDYSLQSKAEEIAKKYGTKNTKNFNASNNAMVAIDPTNGQILTMVGSRDFFDTTIDGQYNVATAYRQPGSTFKPFAYVTAFEKGYTPETVLFDVPTQFSTACDAYGKPLSAGATCYQPQNYDNQFLGPMSMRNSLAQSRNITSIKTLYLAGLKNTLQTAKDMGITSLSNVNQYGLTLVLGGGEVSPLEMTSAYGVFATNGVKNPYTGILNVYDREGKELEKFATSSTQVLPEQPVEQLNDVLSDNNARLPLNGAGSATDFPGQQIALKTGTTNDSRDAWIVGYTPNIVVGAWAGNNDNSAMVHKTSGLIVAPMWREFFDFAKKDRTVQSFVPPTPTDPSLKPILRGIWQGNQTYVIDTTTGKLATDFTPPENRKETAVPNVHSILYWVNTSDPTGPAPSNPDSDPQYKLWEPPVQAWAAQHQMELGPTSAPTQTDDIHTAQSAPTLKIVSPEMNSTVSKDNPVTVSLSYQSSYPLSKAEMYINGTLVDTRSSAPFVFVFTPKSTPAVKQGNQIKVVIYDSMNNKAEDSVDFSVK